MYVSLLSTQAWLRKTMAHCARVKSSNIPASSTTPSKATAVHVGKLVSSRAGQKHSELEMEEIL